MNKIPNEGAWHIIARLINDNFAHIGLSMGHMGGNQTMRLFKSVSEVKKYIPNPDFGQVVLVGATLPAHIYRWDGAIWSDTGSVGGDFSINLDNYYTIEQIDSMLSAIYERLERLERGGVAPQPLHIFDKTFDKTFE